MKEDVVLHPGEVDWSQRGLGLAENAGKNFLGIGHVVVCLFLNTAFEAESFAQISNVL